MSATKADLVLLSSKNGSGFPGSKTMNVAASATLIYSGEIVAQALGDVVVLKMATDKPHVATDYVVGVAMNQSTNTAALAGTVDVVPVNSGDVWLANPTTPANWDTQAEYDALVGKRMVFALSTSTYTIGHTDGATHGCVIQPMDVTKYPGKVAFSFREGCSYLA